MFPLCMFASVVTAIELSPVSGHFGGGHFGLWPFWTSPHAMHTKCG